jgi:signal transduction histidine kinase
MDRTVLTDSQRERKELMEGQRRSPFQQLKGVFQAGLGRGRPGQIDHVASLPRWRESRVGFAISVLFVGLAFVVSFLVAQVQFPFSLPGVLLMCAVLVIALLWGIGPAAFAILLSLLALDYLAVPPFGTLGVPAWRSVLQLLTFALAGTGIAVLANRYEAAFWRLLTLERDRHLRELEEALARERAMRETNLRMEAITATVIHELKTPLTVIKGSLQLCERKVQRFVQAEAPVTVTARECVYLLSLLEQAKQQVTLENRLVNDLVDVSRIKVDQLALLTVPCDLATIVREAVEGARRVACERVIHLVMPPEQAVPVLADPDRIEQVVTNYLSNALTYSAVDRPIEIRLQVEERLARVLVRDEGSGIPLAEQGRIWEPFYRVRGTGEYIGEAVGLGVGLYLCRNIIERHHGQVGVLSAPGKGSTFWFTLPLTEEGSPSDDDV